VACENPQDIAGDGRQPLFQMYYGPEFVSRAVLRWLAQSNIDTACIDPGKPWQNGSHESFNGKFRDECLSIQWFKNRIDAKILVEELRRQFNEVRPHSSLGKLTPAEFKTLSNNTPETSCLLKVTIGPKKAGRSVAYEHTNEIGLPTQAKGKDSIFDAD
jgi:putative transposase